MRLAARERIRATSRRARAAQAQAACACRMCPSAASTLSTGRKYQAEAAATADMRKNMRAHPRVQQVVVLVVCCIAAETRFAGLLSHADECCCCCKGTSATIPPGSPVAIPLASREVLLIDAPHRNTYCYCCTRFAALLRSLTKKSERYRSTAHRRTDRQQFIQVQSFSLPMVGPPE